MLRDLSPRCGKPMTRYEAVNGPMPERPACARPGGHGGRCRSRAALARKYRADAARVARIRRGSRRYGREREYARPAGWPARRAAA